MSPARLVAILRQLRPEDHAASADYARRTRLEWAILRALERRGYLRPLDGRPWTRAELIEDALRPLLVLVVDNDARGEHDTAV